MAKVSKYSILFYSGEQGYQNNPDHAHRCRRQHLRLRLFQGPRHALRARYRDRGIITMHLPSAMLQSILDAVRNEKADIYYQIGRAFLFAKLRRAGQG